ncbi:putative agmatine coumaroyltransferase-2-like [Capsicum annuum]|nr:putative agmatine coumaroyltransferase-2-like [Capsicum annuum]
MGAKGRKKSITKKLKKGASEFSASKDKAADFLPLEGGPARKLPDTEVQESKARVLYIGRIPHGFYENEMEGFFKQFGTIKRLRLARNKKVAKVVADTMHNYLLFEHLLQVRLITPEHVHPKLWKGVNRWYKPLDWVKIERKRHDKERTLEDHNKLVEGILKREKKRRKRIKVAGIDYECPEMVGAIQSAPKKIRFTD